MINLNKLILSVATFGVLLSCNNSNNVATNDHVETPTAPAIDDIDRDVYVANLTPINSKITGTQTSGTVTFTIENDVMTVDIDVNNAPAGITHWQHFHGFKDGRDASCVDSNADKNNDGVIDLIETEAYSGTTMVPFNKMPANMDVGDDTYPSADANGHYSYHVTISMNQLEDAFDKSFGDDDLDLDDRVFYIHGVPTSTDLPASVKSLGDIPATTTLPIACGRIIERD